MPSGEEPADDIMRSLEQLLGSMQGPTGFDSEGQASNTDPFSNFAELLGVAGGAARGGGGAPGDAGAASLVSLLGGAKAPKKKDTDSFMTERLPVLQRLKRPVMASYFAYSFWRGWIGRWGLMQGMTASSYFDMLSVPLRIFPKSPLHGRAVFVTQFWVDSGLRLFGFLINLARGRTTLSDVVKPGSRIGMTPWEMLSGLDSGASEKVIDIPTARTTAEPEASDSSSHWPSPPPDSRASSPILDADVTFLD